MRILIEVDQRSLHPTKDELDTDLEKEQVSEALKALGYEVFEASFSLDLLLVKQQILKSRCDKVFNLVETLEGSRLLHFAPALFEALPVSYTGGTSQGMMLSSDKLLSKRYLALSGVPTPRWIEASQRDMYAQFLGMPLIIKPVCEEASVGITDASVQIFENEQDLAKALQGTASRALFAEVFIAGREFSLSVMRKKDEVVLFPPSEMLFVDYPDEKPSIVGYEAKWEEDSFAYCHTQRSFLFSQEDQNLLDELKDLTLKVFHLFGGIGYARVDFRIDEEKNPYVLELNMNPCIAKDSGFVAAALQAGLTYEQLIEQIIEG